MGEGLGEGWGRGAGILLKTQGFLPGFRTPAHPSAPNPALRRRKTAAGAPPYPEDVIFRGRGHSLLHGLVQLLLGGQVPGDGPADLGPEVMQGAQTSLEPRGMMREGPGAPPATHPPLCLSPQQASLRRSTGHEGMLGGAVSGVSADSPANSPSSAGCEATGGEGHPCSIPLGEASGPSGRDPPPASP